MNKYVALLPMKGESERIANKNIKELNGVPLFFYMADTLREAGFIDHICINTDCDSIRSLAVRRYSDFVRILTRDPSLCGHDVSMNFVIAQDLDSYDSDCTFIQVHATSPFIKPCTLLNAVKTYESNIKLGYDSLLTASSIKARCYTSDFLPLNHDVNELVKTQDLDPVIMENSGIYIFSKSSFSLNNSRIGIRPYLYLNDLSDPQFIDIDNYSDWLLAEHIIRSEEV